MSDRSILTESVAPSRTQFEVRRVRVEVTAGPDMGLSATAEGGTLTLGTAEGTTLRLNDPTVSRVHCEVEATARGVIVRDLGSRNGTTFHDASIREVTLQRSAEFALGRSRVRVAFGSECVALPVATEAAFGLLVGGSAPMRRLFAVLAQAAPTRASVLLTGESGTGKELAARSLHDASERRDGPFEVIDCGGLPATLIEAELFGHERGAFTGAVAAREGAFERADGGTIFLDEFGELPLELQPKLLRVLAEGEVRRVGAAKTRKVDVRVVAATNRDLRAEINAGRFRADLFYRVAVIPVALAPLRERMDDLALLVPKLLASVAGRAGSPVLQPDDPLWATLREHHWPGNVRELKNFLEQWLVLRAVASVRPGAAEVPTGATPDDTASLAPPTDLPADFTGLDELSFRDARAQVLERFERHYLLRVLEGTGWNIAEAARRSGISRVTLFRTIRRYRLREG